MNHKRKTYDVVTQSELLTFGKRTWIMGILNVTPDSFSGDGRWDSKAGPRKAIRHAHKLIRQGADILDIGGESTRPGAPKLSVHEELSRVIPVIESLAPRVSVPISIDTYKPKVAQAAIAAGAKIVNTVKGTPAPKGLLKIVKENDVAIILTHIQGTPKSMQKKPTYRDVVSDIRTALATSVENCLECGIKSDRIIIDPGIGFGKTVEHNLIILNRLKNFASIGVPILIGTSRKSFIGHVLNKDVSARLPGTLATITNSIMNGAHIIRVHDVAAACDVARMTDAILAESGN